MVVVIISIGTTSIIYSSGTALIRFLYIRSSLLMNTQEVLKRDSFVVKSIVIGECISLLNFGYYFCLMGHTSKAEYPMVLYNACLDPWSQFHTSISKVMPLNQIIVFLSTLVNFSSNTRYLSAHKSTWASRFSRSNLDWRIDIN